MTGMPLMMTATIATAKAKQVSRGDMAASVGWWMKRGGEKRTTPREKNIRDVGDWTKGMNIMHLRPCADNHPHGKESQRPPQKTIAQMTAQGDLKTADTVLKYARFPQCSS